MVNPSHPSLRPSAVNSAVKLWDPLTSLKSVLTHIEITSTQQAHAFCSWIPNQCPFERDVVVAGHKLFHIPALCRLNPVYEELMMLRFKALTYLADQCHEDISRYIRP